MRIRNLYYNTETFLRSNVQTKETVQKIHMKYISRIGPITTK